MTDKQPFDREIYDSIIKEALNLTRKRVNLDRTLMRSLILLTANPERSDAEHHTNEYNELMNKVKDSDNKMKSLISRISSMEGAFDIFMEEMAARKYDSPRTQDQDYE